MTDNTKALAQALMNTKKPPFVTQEDIDYALASQQRWISKDDLDMYKNLHSLTKDWKNNSFTELVKLWELRVTNLNQTDPFENPEKILKYFEGLFKILETDKLILYSRTNAYYPEYCNVRLQVYRNALMMACHQEALMVASSELGIALSKKYTEHKLFVRFTHPWDYIHRVIYRTNEDKPTIPPGRVIRSLERESIVEQSITLFDLLRKQESKQITTSEEGKLKKVGLVRSNTNTLYLEDAESWEDVNITLELNSRGLSIKVALKIWNGKFKYLPPQDFKMHLPTGPMSKTGLIFEELASTGIATFDPKCTAVTFKKRVSVLNKLLKVMFGFPTDFKSFRTYNPIRYSQEAKGYIWNLGKLSWKDATQKNDIIHPNNLRGAYLDKEDISSSEENYIEKSRVLNANVKYQDDIELSEDLHRRLVLGWDKHIKPKFKKGTNNITSNIYEFKHYLPPDEDYNEYKVWLEDTKSQARTEANEKK